ncbi:MAG: TadE/TadG family type IV pilus assembly protein [Coriobacteriales bacterium]
MRTPAHLSPRSEEGAAVIEMVFALPVILLMAAAVLDLSALIKCNLALDSAATAAVRYCMDDPAAADKPAELKSYLVRIDPSMKETELTVSLGGLDSQNYTHLIYPYESEALVKRPSRCTYQPFSVELSYTGSFYTLVGRGISLASGGDGSLKAVCCESGCLDRTDGSTW